MIQKKLLKIKNVAYSSVARARLPVGTRCVGLFRENQAGTNIPQSTDNPSKYRHSDIFFQIFEIFGSFCQQPNVDV